MVDGYGFENIESRISSGLADLSASSADEAFPDVPQLRDTPAHIVASSIMYRDRRLSSPNEAQLEEFAPQLRSSVSSWAADPDSGTKLNLTALDHTGTGMSPRSAESAGSAVSAETLHDPDADDWSYLEQIAAYLELRLDTPITASTGYNSIDGHEAAQALGLPEPNDMQMMRLMRAGLIVNKYARSLTPWRDALREVERESEAQARRAHEQQSFIGQRLMKQYTVAAALCDKAAAAEALAIWLAGLERVQRTNRKLLTFDEQTLMLPYFTGWNKETEAVSWSTQQAERLRAHKAAQKTLHLYRSRTLEQKTARLAADSLAGKLTAKSTLHLWKSHLREVSANFVRAQTALTARLQGTSFVHWRHEKSRMVIMRRLEHESAMRTLSQWRLALHSSSRLAQWALKTRQLLLFKKWSSRFEGYRHSSAQITQAQIIVDYNYARSALRKGLLELRCRAAVQRSVEGIRDSSVRMWRAETRLRRLQRLQARERAKAFVQTWRSAFGDALIVIEKGQHILTNERQAAQQLVYSVWASSYARVRCLETSAEAARAVTAGRSGMRTLREKLRSYKGMLETSEVHLARTLVSKMEHELERRKHVRLGLLEEQAVAYVDMSVVAALFRSWRTQRYTIERITKGIESAAQINDFFVVLQTWLSALHDVRTLDEMAPKEFSKLVVSNTFSLWRHRMDRQISIEIEAQMQATLKRGLLAKRLLRSWRRQNHISLKVNEWREDFDRQLAVIYFHKFQGELDRGRAGRDVSELATSLQRTPSRRHAISPKALEIWTAQARTQSPLQRRSARLDEWGATPFSRQSGAASRLLTTPTKPYRLMRDLDLESKK